MQGAESMSQRPFWASIIQWTLWALIMAGLAGWLARGRRKRVVSEGQTVMVYPLVALGLAIFCVVFSLALVVFSSMAPRDNAPWWAIAIFAVMLAGSLHMLVDCVVGRYALTEEGLRYVGVFTGVRLFKWTDLKSLKYAPAMHWFKLVDSEGQVARISVMMTGLPEFARLLMERARHVDIDAATVPILTQTAKGDPPSVWL